jgi:hypothetical protein
MTWLISALPLLGAIIGTSLQFFFSRSSEHRKGQQALRNQAYIDFIKVS